MVRRVVVGIDGSPQSAAALEWAIDRARRAAESLQVVSAYTLPATEFYGFVVDAATIDAAGEYSRQLVAAAGARAREAAPQLEVIETAELGPAGLILASASEDADLLVVGRRGLGSATSAFLGSVSNQLTANAACPVVVVGPQDGDAGTAVRTEGPVVVGVDGSEFGPRALRFALDEARLRGVAVRVVSVAERGAVSASDPELAARMGSSAEVDADRVVSDTVGAVESTHDDPPIETVVESGSPAEVIVEHAVDAQLIVVGSQGKGFLRRVLLGSVSREVLQNAPCPVAVVGPARNPTEQ